MILKHNLATIWKNLKEFVLNAIVKILKKIEKEDEDNHINANPVIMFGYLKENKIKLIYLNDFICISRLLPNTWYIKYLLID